jgi:transcriptional regulator NrdR family protein
MSARGIPCPKPACDSRRHETTHTEHMPSGVIRRRRKCRKCGRRFVTIEGRPGQVRAP